MYFGEYLFKRSENSNVFYIYFDAFAGIFWCLGIFWIILYCFHNTNGKLIKIFVFNNLFLMILIKFKGLVDKFLSNYIFRVGSRLSYSVYVVHFLLMDMYYDSLKAPKMFALINLVSKNCFQWFKPSDLFLIRFSGWYEYNVFIFCNNCWIDFNYFCGKTSCKTN